MKKEDKIRCDNIFISDRYGETMIDTTNMGLVMHLQRFHPNVGTVSSHGIAGPYTTSHKLVALGIYICSTCGAQNPEINQYCHNCQDHKFIITK
jgi:hypothetical protein